MSFKMLISAMSLSAVMTGAVMAQDGVPPTMPEPMNATYSDCHKLDQTYQDQEKDNHSSHREVAHKVAHQADQFCRLANYPKGVALYERALNMLQMP